MYKKILIQVKMKRKVLIFVQDAVGGAERMSVLIGKNINRQKYDVCFCLTDCNAKSSIRDFIPEWGKIKVIPNGNAFVLTLNIVRTIIEEKPYAVFSSVFNINNKYLPFRWLFPKVKVVIRCDNYLYTYSGKQQKMVKALYPKADRIIAQTKEMKDELVDVGIEDSKIVVLQNPIDKQTIHEKLKNANNPYPSNGKKHIVAVGRFSVQKGFDLVVDAFIEVCKHREDVDLTIVGDYAADGGAIYRDINNKVKEANVADRLHCVGYKDNPYVYIKYADCFVLSSRWEGLPNVLIESLYLGTPAAAFECIPVIERIVDNGKTGYCAEKENVESLATAILDTLRIGKIESTYKSAKIEEFTSLLE